MAERNLEHLSNVKAMNLIKAMLHISYRHHFERQLGPNHVCVILSRLCDTIYHVCVILHLRQVLDTENNPFQIIFRAKIFS